MPLDKAGELLQLIEEKTKSRKLQWQSTAQGDRFVAPLAGKYTIKAFSFTEQPGDGPPSFTLFGPNEEIVLDVTWNTPDISPEKLSEIYQLVRVVGTGMNEKLDDAIGLLKRL